MLPNGTTYRLSAMGDARIFAVWEQRGGRAKGKGGQQRGIMSLASSLPSLLRGYK